MWNQYCCEYINEDDICDTDWCVNSKKVKGRFGLAFVAETPCCYPEPIGWQVEFCDTPSNVEQRCKEMVMWANCPPLPRCEPCPPTEIISPCYPPKCNPCCPMTSPSCVSPHYPENHGSYEPCCSSSSRRKCRCPEARCEFVRPTAAVRSQKQCRCREDANNSCRRYTSSDEEEEAADEAYDVNDTLRGYQSGSSKYGRQRSYRSGNCRCNNLYDEIPVKEVRQKSPASRAVVPRKRNSLTKREAKEAFATRFKRNRSYPNNSLRISKRIDESSTPTDASFGGSPTFARRHKRAQDTRVKSRLKESDDRYKNNEDEYKRGNVVPKHSVQDDFIESHRSKTTHTDNNHHKRTSGEEKGRESAGDDANVTETQPPPYQTIEVRQFQCVGPFDQTSNCNPDDQSKSQHVDCGNSSGDSLDLPEDEKTDVTNQNCDIDANRQRRTPTSVSFGNAKANRSSYPSSSTFPENIYTCTPYPNTDFLYINQPPPYVLDVRQNGIPINAQTMTSNLYVPTYNFCSMGVPLSKINEVADRDDDPLATNTENYYMFQNKHLYVTHIPPFAVTSRPPVCKLKSTDAKRSVRLSCENRQILQRSSNTPSSKTTDSENVKTNFDEQERGERENAAISKDARRNQLFRITVCEEKTSAGILDYHSAYSRGKPGNDTVQAEQTTNQINFSKHDGPSNDSPNEMKHEPIKPQTETLAKSKHTLCSAKQRRSSNINMKKTIKSKTMTNMMAQGDVKRRPRPFTPSQSVRFKDVEDLSDSDILTYFRGKSNFDSMSSTDGGIADFISNLGKTDPLKIPSTVQEVNHSANKQTYDQNGMLDKTEEHNKEHTTIKIMRHYRDKNENGKRIKVEEAHHQSKTEIPTSSGLSRSPGRVRKIEETVEMQEFPEIDDPYIGKKKRWPFDFLRNISRRLGDMFKNAESDSDSLTEPIIYIDGVQYSCPSKYMD